MVHLANQSHAVVITEAQKSAKETGQSRQSGGTSLASASVC